jgi:rhodanese-related sulfurtransferase
MFSSKKLRSFLLVYLSLIGLFSFGPAFAEYREIDSDELQQLLALNVDIIDVRREDEWEDTGIIADSKLATFFDRFGRFDGEDWMKQIEGQQYKDKPIILICHSGVRSRVIGRWLSSVLGYSNVLNVRRGIVDWKVKGHETVAWQPPVDGDTVE